MKVATAAALALLATSLGGCLSQAVKTDPYAKDPIARVEAPIRMSSGFSPELVELMEDGRLIRIYTQMNHIGDPSSEQLLFPPRVAQQLGLTNKQMNRRFGDILRATRRFTVFDADYTVVQNQSQQRFKQEDADIVVDCQVVEARQRVLDVAPYRKVLTTVKLSVRMVNRLTGESLFDGDVAVEGTWGQSTGEGTLLAPGATINGIDMQQQIGADYEQALTKALNEAADRIIDVIRPIGRITFADKEAISMFGGSRNGFMSRDEIVVFRTFTRKMPDGKDKIFRTQAIAVARCDGVGTETSQCDIIRLAPGLTPKDGDFAVLSDESARRVRRK